MKKYVTFEDALKANTEGKTVTSWLDNEVKPYNIHPMKNTQLGEVTIHKILLQGDELTRFSEIKWTINES